MDIVDYTLAKCCNPIAGDDVFGFVTAQEGIKIHRANCPNATELLSKHSHRVVKAKWASETKKSFLTGLKIRGTDRVGVINDVTSVISSELQVNMRSVSIESDNGVFEGDIQLFVNDTQHLDLLKKKLEKIPGVEQVKRFDIS
jgi:GTP pyrophosphokinase